MEDRTAKVIEVVGPKTSSDDRRYFTAYFQPTPPKPGVLTNAKARGRNIWEEGPMGSRGDALFPELERRQEQINNGNGPQVLGQVVTVETEPYYIPNENGKHTDPETGQPANLANTYSSFVFEDESIDSLLPDGVVRKGQEVPASATLPDEEAEIIDEEMTAEESA